jgi:hypothetical protein
MSKVHMNMQNDSEWKDIEGYEDLYMINRNGDIISKKTGNKLKYHYHKQGYLLVNLYKHWTNGKLCKVHRLLAIAFLPNPNKYRVVNHKNGIKDDNRLENLEWCTHKHNTQEALKMGLLEPQRQAVIQRNSKVIIDLNTGVYYESAKELSNLLGVVHGTLVAWLNGKNPNKTSYKYA